MLNKLNWEPLASRRRAARLVMFSKIHHKLVEVNMPLDRKLHVRSTRKENLMAYHIPTASTDYQKNSFFNHTVPDRNCLPKDTVCSSTPESSRAHISPWNTSTAWYSTFTGERESQPFREERETAHSCDIITVGLTRTTLHTVGTSEVYGRHRNTPNPKPKP